MGREKREKERLKNKKNGIVIKQEKKRKMDETEREDNTRRQKTRERRKEKKTRQEEKKNRKPFPRPGHCFEIPPLPK